LIRPLNVRLILYHLSQLSPDRTLPINGQQWVDVSRVLVTVTHPYD